MNNKDVVQESVWECKRTKIELEHEVLLREFDALLIGLVGLPIAVVTIAFQFQAWQNSTILLFLGIFTIASFLVMDQMRVDTKEKIVAKEKELDALIVEMTKTENHDSSSR
jgi:hypothetical protein